jgi:hypothetical protein
MMSMGYLGSEGLGGDGLRSRRPCVDCLFVSSSPAAFRWLFIVSCAGFEEVEVGFWGLVGEEECCSC